MIVHFVSDRISRILLRGCQCNIIVLNVHAPIEEKSEDSKGRFYEKFEHVFNHFLKVLYENSVRRF